MTKFGEVHVVSCDSSASLATWVASWSGVTYLRLPEAQALHDYLGQWLSTQIAPDDPDTKDSLEPLPTKGDLEC